MRQRFGGAGQTHDDEGRSALDPSASLGVTGPVLSFTRVPVATDMLLHLSEAKNHSASQDGVPRLCAEGLEQEAPSRAV